MNPQAAMTLLAKSVDQSKRAAVWLEKSMKKCSGVNLQRALSEKDFDNFENLTSRFARLSTTLDTLNRAAKRGLVESDETARKIRELRYSITHEYSEEELSVLFEEVRRLSPVLLKIQKDTELYCQGLIRKAEKT